MALSGSLTPVAIKEAEKAQKQKKKQIRFTAPSGRVYTWTEKRPPTQADFDAIRAHEEARVGIDSAGEKVAGALKGLFGRSKSSSLDVKQKVLDLGRKEDERLATEEYQRQMTGKLAPNAIDETTIGLAGSRPTDELSATGMVRQKLKEKTELTGRAVTSAIGGAAQFGAALATGGASSIYSVAAEGLLNAAFGPPGEADAVLALLPSALRGSKKLGELLKTRNKTGLERFLREKLDERAGQRILQELGVTDESLTLKPRSTGPTKAPPKVKTDPAPPVEAEVISLPKTKTSVALRESELFGMRPGDPARQTMHQWSDEAQKLGYGTQDGAASILAKSGRGESISASETIGLGARLAAINDELSVVGRNSSAGQKLVEEAKAIRSIRHTEEARSLAARAVLVDQDYSPQGFITAWELKTGREASASESKRLLKMAEDLAASQKRADELAAEIEKLRANPPPVLKKTKITPQEERRKALDEFLKVVGKASLGIDPSAARPLGKIVASYLREGAETMMDAARIARDEIKAASGMEYSLKELEEAGLAYGNARGPRPQRILTEQQIFERRQAQIFRKKMEREIEAAGMTTGQKIGKAAAGMSTEVKLWNPIARAVDLGATVQEAIIGSLTSPIERPVANLVAKLAGADARFGRLSTREKASLAGRFVSDMKANIRSAATEDVSKVGGTGPATHFAGMLDAPGRTWHFLSYAGERAKGLAKDDAAKFDEILDQIRDPYLPGPLDGLTAKKLHEEANDYASVQVLTNANWTTKAKGLAHQLVESSVPDGLKPAGHFVSDLMFQFGRVLVNVTDKTAQYSSPLYSAFRAGLEMMPRKGAMPIEMRARTLAQIARRTGVGAALSQLGYWYYKDNPNAENDLSTGGVPLGSTIVRTLSKDGKKTGSVYQDDGYIAMFGGAMAAFMHGYRNAQIDSNTQLTDGQRDRMRRDLFFAPITDNPVMGNASRIFKALESGERGGGSLWGILTGLYYPGGLREWARIQDLQEGVFSRRAEGPVQELQRRVPYAPKLPAKGVKEVRP